MTLCCKYLSVQMTDPALPTATQTPSPAAEPDQVEYYTVGEIPFDGAAQLASLVVARTTPPEELAAMRQLFETLDTDHSGTISYEKLHKGLDEKCHVRLCYCPARRTIRLQLQRTLAE